jgi:hypothetical protein
MAPETREVIARTVLANPAKSEIFAYGGNDMFLHVRFAAAVPE